MSQEKDSIPHTSRSLRALWFCFLTTRCLMKTMEIANDCILRRDTHCTVHNPGSKIQLLLHLPSKNNWFTPVQKKKFAQKQEFPWTTTFWRLTEISRAGLSKFVRTQRAFSSSFISYFCPSPVLAIVCAHGGWVLNAVCSHCLLAFAYNQALSM